MADKALISDLTWRSLQMQKAAFPDMPHYIAPDEIPNLLRPTTRTETLNIHVLSLGCIADNADDFEAFMRRLPKHATIRSKEEGHFIGHSFPIKKARVMFQAARKYGVAKVGGRVSADNRKAKSAEGAAKIKDRWGMDSKTWPTHVLLKEADISYNTAKTLLPPRPVAQYNYRAKNGRQIKAIILDPKPREKLDFCGLYVFQIDDDVFKIGTSRNSETRLKQVSAYHKKRMKVVALFNMAIEKAQALECEVHYRLRKHLHPEYNGREIFRTSLKTINRTIKQATKHLFEVPNEV